MAIEEIARRVDMSRRTVYRDLKAIEGEIGHPALVGGRTVGRRRGGLPAVAEVHPRRGDGRSCLSARLMVRYADKYDPDLASAFEKLGEVLPAALGEHVARTLDVLSRHPRDERFSRHVRLLTKAWAERRIVSLDYDPARYGPDSAPRTARVRPYLIEPSLQTHALYLVGFDETRGAVRTFKVERIRDMSVRPIASSRRRRASRGRSTGPGTSSPTRSRSTS
jgi:predicted DNA-binding transcriptional regulator YafY